MLPSASSSLANVDLSEIRNRSYWYLMYRCKLSILLSVDFIPHLPLDPTDSTNATIDQSRVD